MSDRYDVIEQDGVYTDAKGASFQFRKGHLLAPGQIRADGIKRTGDLVIETPEGDAAKELQDAAKAAQVPENKAAPAPKAEDKK